MFNSINSIDKQLFANHQDFRKRDGFFIEAGANDGIRQSNTLFFEQTLNWTGILIEPIPRLYQDCVKNRHFRNAIYNYALVADDYKDEKIIIEYTPETHGLMSVAKGLPHTAAHLKKSGDEGQGMWCNVITLNKILSLQHISYVDLLVLDVEGYEVQALRGCDFTKININYIVIEQQYNSKAIDQQLNKFYKKISQLSEHDYLWKRK